MASLSAEDAPHPWPLDGCVHLWPVPRERGERERLIAFGAPLLSGAEEVRSQTFRSATGRRRFLLGRALIKKVLAGYLGVAPDCVEISLGRHGKPAVGAAADVGLAFNMSHSGTEMVLAVARADGLGVDLEEAGRADAALRIAARFFSREERFRLHRRKTASAMSHDALLLWTLKESIAKALGRTVWDGLSDYLLAISAGSVTSLAPLPGSGDRRRAWKLSVGRWRREHVLALALYWDREPAPRLSFRAGGAHTGASGKSCTYQPIAAGH